MATKEATPDVLVFTIRPDGWLVCVVCGEKSIHHGYDCQDAPQ